jgi:two-component sensor histidine kinase
MTVDLFPVVGIGASAGGVEIRAEERPALLVAELNHRVKNILAVVSSTAIQLARRSTIIGEFADGLIGGIRGLVKTHELSTNAMTYGALSRAGGRLEGQTLNLTWSEMDGRRWCRRRRGASARTRSNVASISNWAAPPPLTIGRRVSK